MNDGTVPSKTEEINDNPTIVLTKFFLKIANFFVDLIVKIRNGETIQLPSLGDFGGIFTK